MQWLEVQPEDDEKTRAKKRKMAKSYKSKIRFQKMDAQQRDKQSSWLDFQKGKGTKKKAGFFTGLHFAMCAHAVAHSPHGIWTFLPHDCTTLMLDATRQGRRRAASFPCPRVSMPKWASLAAARHQQTTRQSHDMTLQPLMMRHDAACTLNGN